MMRPSTFARWALAVLVTSLGLIGMARLSAAPVRLAGAEVSRLRLSWSARPERIEKCRVLSNEELEKLEAHMRQRIECEGRFASYSLRVSVDGRLLHEAVVTGAGLRNDRPIYLLEDLDVEPGVRRVRVTFDRREKNEAEDADDENEKSEESRADTGIFAGREQRERVERARRARAAIRPNLALDTALVFQRGGVVIVTLDPESGSLQVLAGAPPSK